MCNDNGYTACSQKDDAPEILEKMVQADVIVMATPVYFYTMNGQLKTLIDRCCSRYTSKIEMSAGDTPEILVACPTEAGRILLSFWRASNANPAIF